MKNTLNGKVVLLGKNIDTDQIYPGRYLALVDGKEVGEHCLEGVSEDIRKKVHGNIIIAGTNFGCGSSREHAVITLLNAGVQAVIAESFARIFFRNAINLGLPVLICPKITETVKMDDDLFVDLQTGKIQDSTQNIELKSEPLGEHILRIVEAGGIKSLIRKQLGKK